MRYGYVRVSTVHQDTARQEVLMKELGVDKVFIDKCTGKNTKRPMLEEMFRVLKAGDVVVVESYSRMSRSTKDLLEIVERLGQMDVDFVSKKEAVDTSTPTGRMLLTVIAGLNQFEREVMLERQRESIAAMPVVDGKKVSARTGRGFGRPKAEVDRAELGELVQKQRSGELTVKECCDRLGIGKTTWYEMVGKAAV